LARKQKSAEQKTKTIHEDEAGKMKQKLDKANSALLRAPNLARPLGKKGGDGLSTAAAALPTSTL
jgi:hypothetical protein